MDDDITIIKSLIAISKGGLLLADIPKQFREMNESSLNFRKYGFESIEQMLQSSKEIVLQPSARGTLCKVNDEKMNHVTSLVDRARVPKSKRKKLSSKPRSNHYGVKRGSISEPQRRPFQPANRMHYDNHRRTASPRPQAVSRYQTSSSMKQYSQNSCRNNSYRPNLQYDDHRRTASTRPQAVSMHSTSSSMKQYSQNSCRTNSSVPNFSSTERSKPLQSSSIGSTVSKPLATTDNTSSGWSSDSSELPHTVVSSKSTVRKPLDSSNLGSQTVLKVQAVHEASTSTTSGSDWSSLDSGSVMSPTDQSKKITTHPRIEYPSVPLQNCAVSSTIKQTKSDSNSDWSDSSGHSRHRPSQSSLGCSKPSSSAAQFAEPPLMVGGVGRGKLYPQLSEARPGRNEGQMHGLQSPSKDVIVTGSPCKRETSTRMKDGLSTILVRVRNEPAIAIPKLKEATISHQKSSIASYQFVGDFLLHRVAEVTLGLKFPKNRGLCRSHFSILDCIKEIQKNRDSRPIILMIGMTDILEGATFDEMKQLTTLLLQMLSSRSIVLLTLPVPPSFIKIGFEGKLAVLEKYNKWLLNLQLPTIIETEQYLYCDAPFYSRYATSEVETFSDAGCWVVIDEIIGAAT